MFMATFMNSMMTFMKEFSDVFPFDNYPMSKDKYKNMSDEELKDVNDKLKIFQDKIIETWKQIRKNVQRYQTGMNNERSPISKHTGGTISESSWATAASNATDSCTPSNSANGHNNI